MKKKLICHVCKKGKKPYIVIMDSNMLSMVQHLTAREDGEICERCNNYYAMTGEFKDATKEEYEIAEKSAWFARMVLKWWEKDESLEHDEDKGDIESVNMREWGGTHGLASWCRKELARLSTKGRVK